MDNYSVLIAKLDEFIRKFYKNQLLKGLIVEVGLFLSFFLVLSSLEYYGHFDTLIRTLFFYSFVFANLFVITKYIMIPLFSLFRLGKVISHKQAAEVIGNHFSNIKDKLLNTLQLKEQFALANSDSASVHLIKASIDQRIEELRPVPFSSVISLQENVKYLKYILPVILLFMIIYHFVPELIRDSTFRLIEHRTYFAKPAPFTFKMVNPDLSAVQNDDYTLDVTVNGKEIPQDAFIEVAGNQYKLDKNSRTSFAYSFKNLQSSQSFRFLADGFYSEEFLLRVLPKPTVLSFSVAVDYPAYLNKKPELFKNLGDITIPSGSVVKWHFQTRNVNQLYIRFNDTLLSVSPAADNEFLVTRRMFKSTDYSVSGANKDVKNKDSIRYALNVIPDLFPSIEVEQQVDSMHASAFYFRGIVKDDYGFSKLAFNYKVHSDNRDEPYKQEALNINKSILQQQFFHQFDASVLHLSPGQEVEYFFEIWDNDAIAGRKSTRSGTFLYKAPSKEQMEESVANQNKQLQGSLKESIKEAKLLQKDISDLNKRMLENKNLSWEDKKKAADLLKKQKDLEKKLESIKNQNQQNQNFQNENLSYSEEIKDKQEQLNKLMENLMTDEMKKFFGDLEKMMENLDKQKLQEKLDQIKLSNKDVEKELDRSLELFKKLELEKELDKNIQKLNDLAEEQNKLADEAMKKNADSESLKEQQKQKKEEFDKLSKAIEELEKKDKDLESPLGFNNPEKDEKDIKEEMQQSEEQLQDKKNSKASQSQKSASKKMKDMAQKLGQMKQGLEAKENEEDINALRALLENLLKLSFSQEQLMKDLKTTDINNPQYLKISQQQRRIKESSRMIEDSLFALSKRAVQIKSIVNREIASINQNIDKSLNYLELRDVSQAASRQQYAMTSINNLALLLDESLQQMQQQMAQQMKSGSCSKPGSSGKKPGMSALKKMQESLNKEMEGMKKGNGQKEGSGMSQQLARMAAQQQAIRNELQKMMQQKSDKGDGSKGEMNNMLNKMEQTQKEIVNNKINPETYKRQQEILTRLLDAEKAEKEREMDEKRQSTEAKSLTNRNPAAFEEYKRLKLKETELLKSVPPALNGFYKQKSIDYFQKLGN